MAAGMIRPYDSKVNAISRLIDTAIIVVTFVALMAVFQMTWTEHAIWTLFFSVVFFSFIAESQDTYRSWRGVSIQQEVGAVFWSWFGSVLALILFNYALFDIGRKEYLFGLVWFVITPLELISWHVIIRLILRWLRSHGMNTRQVAIVGQRAISRQLEEALQEMDWSGYRLVGYYDDRNQKRATADAPKPCADIKGNIDQMIAQCKKSEIDTVFIALPMAAEHRIKDIAHKLSDTTASVYVVPDLFTFKLLNSRWVDYQGTTAISIYETPYAGLDSFIKRAEDIVLSLMILNVVAIPMLIIAMVVRFTSKGPVLFKQTRYGMNGEKIRVWKFRTMTVAEDGDSVAQATVGDKRITPVGGFLRRNSLDELPQFFNALTGGMSVVGPRPHAVAHNEQYRSLIQGYMLRHKVKPGITGLAQINGFRGETDTIDKMEGRINLDLRYIQTWSVLLDLKIVFLTVFNVFNHKHAY